MVTLRASWGEGFKAPNLGNIGQSLSQSFNEVVDTTFCSANGISDADCPNTQAENYRGGNPDLQAELSESWNVGIVVDPIENLTFSIDWWNIEIEDKVSLLSLQNVINFELLPTPPDDRAPDNPWPQWPKIFRVDYGHEESEQRYGKDPREYSLMSKRFLGDDEGNLTGIVTVQVEWTNTNWSRSSKPTA